MGEEGERKGLTETSGALEVHLGGRNDAAENGVGSVRLEHQGFSLVQVVQGARVVARLELDRHSVDVVNHAVRTVCLTLLHLVLLIKRWDVILGEFGVCLVQRHELAHRSEGVDALAGFTHLILFSLYISNFFSQGSKKKLCLEN